MGSDKRDEYPELKKNLLDAIVKKNPDELASAINAIERNIPPSQIPEKDKKLQVNAKELLNKIDPQASI